mmetsp:Transcript_23713/g.57446  ORF Transcript_23713/g.57446 Transcript_23713/m.57446 type:complete len:540 (+) Transcript_23713:206-1825(+)
MGRPGAFGAATVACLLTIATAPAAVRGFRPMHAQRRCTQVAPAIRIDASNIPAETPEKLRQHAPGILGGCKKVSIPRSVCNSVRQAILTKQQQGRKMRTAPSNPAREILIDPSKETSNLRPQVTISHVGMDASEGERRESSAMEGLVAVLEPPTQTEKVGVEVERVQAGDESEIRLDDSADFQVLRDTIRRRRRLKDRKKSAIESAKDSRDEPVGVAITVPPPRRQIRRIEEKEEVVEVEKELEIPLPETTSLPDMGWESETQDWRSQRVQYLLEAGPMVQLDPNELNKLLSPGGRQRNRFRNNPLVSYGVVVPLEGLLLDTSRLHLKVWNRLAARHRLKTPSMANVLWAMSKSPYDAYGFEDSAQRILGIDALVEDTTQLRREFLQEIGFEFSQSSPSEISVMADCALWMEGLLNQGVRVSLVSKLPRHLATLLLNKVKLDPDALGAGGLVAETEIKEDTQLLLSASLRMLRQPQRTLVVTNRPGESSTAHEAGMRSLAVAGNYHRWDLSDADVVVDSLSNFAERDLVHAFEDTVYDV